MTEQLSSLDPPNISLLPGEELKYSKQIIEPVPPGYPSAVKWIQQLGRVGEIKKIGEAGPLLASLSLNENEVSDYEVVFGRDSLRSAITLLPFYPNLARETLIHLSRSQGVEYDAAREEEPGRIIHEERNPDVDPRAQQLTKERGWGWPYYGSNDATLEFVRTLVAYCRQVSDGRFLGQSYIGRDKKEHTLADALSAAVNWTTNRLAANSEGLLESKRAIPGGIEYQFWKDSWDAYFQADGTLADPDRGVSSIEVQRVVYDALTDTAELYKSVLGKQKEANELEAIVAQVKQQIFDIYWTDERGGYFILGTDRDEKLNLRRLMVKSSNMGHMLHSRLLMGDDPDIANKREAVIRQLFSPEMLGLNGIRTIATTEARFRPGAYHNGSVWVWDNYLIAQGFYRHGYYGLARFIEDLLLDDIKATHRLAEFFRGDNQAEHRLNTWEIDVYDRKYKRINRVEQPPQDIQAWSAAAILSIKMKRSKVPSAAQDKDKLAFEQQILDETRSRMAA